MMMSTSAGGVARARPAPRVQSSGRRATIRRMESGKDTKRDLKNDGAVPHLRKSA